MDQIYTQPELFGPPPNRSWAFWIGKNLGKSFLTAIPEYLIEYAKKASGRNSIAYETMAKLYKRAFAKRKQIVLNPPPAKKRRLNDSHPNRLPRQGPLTSQNDFMIKRGKKRLTKRQKRWKKFVRRVHKAETANDKTHFMVEANNAFAQIVGTAGFLVQDVFNNSSAGDDYNLLLSSVGNVVTGPLLFVDNLRLQKSVTTVAVGTVPTTTDLKDLRYSLLGAACTISWRAKSLSSLFVDIYECVAAQDIIDSQFATAKQAWEQCLTANGESDQTTTRAKLTYNFTGCTPYQAPGFAKYWKILKKTRVLCAASSKTNYTYYTKGRFINNAKVVGQYATKGLTKDLIIVANPTFHGDVTAVPQIDLEWSKSYALKMEDVPGLQTQWAYQVPY